MLSSTCLFSFSRPGPPLASPCRPPKAVVVTPERLSWLPLQAPHGRLVRDSRNLDALFIHFRINFHPSEPLRGSVTAADLSLGGAHAELSIRGVRGAGCGAGRRAVPCQWDGAEGRSGGYWGSWAPRAWTTLLWGEPGCMLRQQRGGEGVALPSLAIGAARGERDSLSLLAGMPTCPVYFIFIKQDGYSSKSWTSIHS